jgi:hypothetical protein
MTKKELLKKWKELEKRIEELEARPVGYYCVYPYYYYPRPWHGITDPPWIYPTITSGGWVDSSGDTATAYTTENVTFTSGSST